jgi:stalled ribosome alternative rescue factor ArfA
MSAFDKYCTKGPKYSRDKKIAWEKALDASIYKVFKKTPADLLDMDSRNNKVFTVLKDNFMHERGERDLISKSYICKLD